jgi:hypothetical protein
MGTFPGEELKLRPRPHPQGSEDSPLPQLALKKKKKKEKVTDAAFLPRQSGGGGRTGKLSIFFSKE